MRFLLPLASSHVRRLIFLAPLLFATAAVASEPQPTPLITKTSDQLVTVLKSGADRKEKADACRELAVVGNSSAVPELVRLLADEDLNHMALYALETLPGSSVSKALRNELAKLQGRRLIGVIGALGARRDSKAVKPLTHLLASRDPGVAETAARALGRIGSENAAKAILAALSSASATNRAAFCEGCLRCAERLAADGESAQAAAIYERLRGETTLPGPARMAALRGALLSRGAKDPRLLKECLASGDHKVFTTAVQVATEIPGPEITRALADGLSRLPADDQVVVAQALGARGDDEALPSLCALAAKTDLEPRLAALGAIAAIGGPLAVPIMVRNISSGEPAVSRAARDGLAGIPGPKADAAAIGLLADDDVARRIIGIRMVRRRRLTGQLPAIVKACSNTNANVRLAALRCLGELGGPDDLPALIQLVSRPGEKSDCAAAADALETLMEQTGKSDAATTRIVSAMKQAQAKQKCAFLGVLCFVGGTNALAGVRSSLNDTNADVRDAAIRALASWSDPSAAAELTRILHSTNAIPEREVVFRGFVRLANDSTNPAVSKFQMLCQAAAVAVGPQDQKLVLSGLGNVISVDSLRLVATHLSNPLLADDASAAAIKIAGKLGAKYRNDVGFVLNQVLKTAKSQRLLDQARACIQQLAGPPKSN